MAIVPSDWGVFTRGSTTLTSGEVLVDDWFTLDGEPVLTLFTANTAEAETMLPRVAVFFADRTGWQRRATDAICTEFSHRTPTPADFVDAAADLALTTVEVHPGGDLMLHFTDTCGKHFLDGYWPSVRFDAETARPDVSIEA